MINALLLLLVAQDARALYVKGQVDYDAGRYDDAAREFRASYDLSHAPGLLYNLGQTYRLQGKCREALDAYEGYLREMPAAKNRAVAEKQRDEVKKCAGPSTKTENRGAPSGSIVLAERPTAVNTHISTLTPEPARPSRWPSLALGASGVAISITGALLASHAGGEFDRLQASCGTRCPPSSWDGLGAQEKTGWALVAVGGLAIAGGVVLWFRESRVSVTTDGRSIAVAGRF